MKCAEKQNILRYQSHFAAHAIDFANDFESTLQHFLAEKWLYFSVCSNCAPPSHCDCGPSQVAKLLNNHQPKKLKKAFPGALETAPRTPRRPRGWKKSEKIEIQYQIYHVNIFLTFRFHDIYRYEIFFSFEISMLSFHIDTKP